MRKGRFCVICGHSNKENLSTLFSFPKNLVLKQRWKERLNIIGECETTGRVCQLHFQKNQFNGLKLKPGALPTLKTELPRKYVAEELTNNGVLELDQNLTYVPLVFPITKPLATMVEHAPAMESSRKDAPTLIEKSIQCTL